MSSPDLPAARLLWGRRTWTEIQALVPQGLVALLPVGATEAHGPHLALDTDVAIAEGVALEAARRLTAAGRPALVLPPLAYAVTRFAAAFPGTVGLSEASARAVLADILAALAAQGVRTLGIVNHHLEPAHVLGIREVAAAAPAGLRVAFPEHARRPYAMTLGDEFRSGDCHAGRYETSLVLALPEGETRVREGVCRALPRRDVGLVAAIRAGKGTFAECGAPEAYTGDPAGATAEEGRALIERLAEIVVVEVATLP